MARPHDLQQRIDSSLSLSFCLNFLSFCVNSLSFCSLPCMLVHTNMQCVYGQHNNFLLSILQTCNIQSRRQIAGFSFLARSFPFLARPLDSVGGGIDHMRWQTDEPRQLSHQNDVHTLFFLVVGEKDVHVKNSSIRGLIGSYHIRPGLLPYMP